MLAVRREVEKVKVSLKGGRSVKWNDEEELEAGEWKEIGAGQMKRQSGGKGEADKGTQCEGQVIP